MKELKELLTISVKNSVEDKVAIAFSGGLDSSLIALLASKFSDVQLYVCGTENSFDIIAAKSAAEILNLPLEIILINKEDVREAVPIVSEIIENIDITEEMKKSVLPPHYPNPVSISFNLPLYFVVKNCKEKIILSAQGPDTMFGGFYIHLKMGKDELEKELRKNTEDLVLVGKKQHEDIGKYFGKEVRLPYISKKIIEFALRLPVELKVKDNKRKIILVETAKEVGLPKEIAEREKKSAQYGSGVMKLMKKIKQELH